MGIERAATRWYLQRIACENETAVLEARLAEMQHKSQGSESNQRVETEKQLADVRAKLHALGPCPKAMMG